MYISACFVSYIVVVMFTCTLVRSHPESRRLRVKLEPLSLTAINSLHQVGCGNKMHARKKGPEPGSVYTQSEAMKDVFARCHKKTDVQVCTLTIVYYCLVTVNIRAIATVLTPPSDDQQFSSLCMYKSVTVILIGVYFSQAKNKP
jgi:hypothetical protein